MYIKLFTIINIHGFFFQQEIYISMGMGNKIITFTNHWITYYNMYCSIDTQDKGYILDTEQYARECSCVFHICSLYWTERKKGTVLNR